jgi:hypothetical protein
VYAFAPGKIAKPITTSVAITKNSRIVFERLIRNPSFDFLRAR